MTKMEMNNEIKRLRIQMANLEEKCKAREDKLVWLIEVLEPFLEGIAEAQKAGILQAVEKDGR